MLIRCTFKNIYSYRDKTSFSMIPNLTRKKGNHKSQRIDGISELVTSVVYGANASGKSNLVKAIGFGQNMILRGSGAMADYEPFRLDVATRNSPSSIEFEFQSGGKNYAYGFDFDHNGIIEEWLYRIKRNSQNRIFERKIVDGKTIFNFDYLLNLNRDNEQQQFLSYLFKSTPDQELFLHSVIGKKTEGNINHFEDVSIALNWFQNTLTVLMPNQSYREGIKSEIGNNDALHDIYEEVLKFFDTGISKINLQEIEESKLDVPKFIIEKILQPMSRYC